MGDILNMDEYRPHINIEVDGAIHVYPLVYFKDLADGKEVEPLPPEILRFIISDWLEWLKWIDAGVIH